MANALGPEGGKTKFILTAGDERVCPICQGAEMDGAIPVNQPYSNGRMGPPFHGKTCRCKQITSGELAASLEVRATEVSVDVGLIDHQLAQAGSLMEYGLGNGPPNPVVTSEMENLGDEVFEPLFYDLYEHFSKKFLSR